MSDFPAMDWHDHAESHAYWRRRVRTPHPVPRSVPGDGPLDRTFIKNYIAFVEAICGTTERSQRGRSISRHDA
jgi:hypothetical protein